MACNVLHVERTHFIDIVQRIETIRLNYNE